MANSDYDLYNLAQLSELYFTIIWVPKAMKDMLAWWKKKRKTKGQVVGWYPRRPKRIGVCVRRRRAQESEEWKVLCLRLQPFTGCSAMDDVIFIYINYILSDFPFAHFIILYCIKQYICVSQYAVFFPSYSSSYFKLKPSPEVSPILLIYQCAFLTAKWKI